MTARTGPLPSIDVSDHDRAMRYRSALRWAGICMTCLDGAPEPYGCTDCLNTGYAEGNPFDQIKALEAENKRLRDALEFYANPEVYKPHPHGPAFDRPDKSYAARAALEASR